ncbi:hypothetical protein BDY17DRAFT_323067 [Neohortaea acidophila]|uniref:DUF4097 domain-containing protein n=1 Tax=Neohortaea acidophila TaxID=245834 RepID=A0A6A6PVL0_9PEZI|nr:uncharacterized protein BDY17DRAFT_323067 [Neohortaea acidophila]KAF2484198.1 hypothetical protein BDY17DRAFT_323067 [Neohortaea acidophila]
MANSGLSYESDLEDAGSDYDVEANDSDAESLLDLHQSPADGYFERRNLPRQNYTENPAIQSNKAREAAQARAHNQAEASNPTYAPAHIIESAPPDYNTATAGQREQQREAFDADHPLVRNGLLHDFGGSSARFAPQSMRDPVHPAATDAPAPAGDARDGARLEEQPTERTALLSSAGDSKQPPKSRRSKSRCGKGCLLAVIVVLLAILAIIITAGSRESSSSPSGDGSPGEKVPSVKPPRDPTPPHPSRSGSCPLNSFSKTESFNFTADGGNFSLIERIERLDYASQFWKGLRISGTVKISPAGPEQEESGPDIRVWVNYATMAPLDIVEGTYVHDDDGLELRFPKIKLNDWLPNPDACIDMAVAIHVTRNAKLGDWTTWVKHMDVVVEPHLFRNDDELDDSEWMQDSSYFTPPSSSSIHTSSGDIDIAYWDSRRTVIDSSSGSVEGAFALRDLLAIRTASGSMDVKIEPKPADKAHPKPATYALRTSSGSITAAFNVYADDIPARHYEGVIETSSGSIKGGYILGDHLTIHTNSGNIGVSVLPYAADLASSRFETSSGSGRTELEFLSPYTDTLDTADVTDSSKPKHRTGIIDGLQSVHNTTSGSIQLEYPDEWEGEVDAWSSSGHVDIRGRDLKIYYDYDIPTAGHQVVGLKGDGSSKVKLKSSSGSIDALFGDEKDYDEGREEKKKWRWGWKGEWDCC